MKFLQSLVLFSSLVNAIPHDKVKGFKQDAPSIFLTYKPWLNVYRGCVPFPAVNAEGETR